MENYLALFAFVTFLATSLPLEWPAETRPEAATFQLNVNFRSVAGYFPKKHARISILWLLLYAEM